MGFELNIKTAVNYIMVSKEIAVYLTI